jgi:hypothetical protein
MDFGELMYFIIGIAWLLYSFRKKKKATPAKPNQESQEIVQDIEVMMDQPMEEEVPDIHMVTNEPTVDPVAEHITPKPAPNTSSLDKVPANYFENTKMGDNVEKSTRKQEKSSVMLQEEEAEAQLDLRQAIIHSEILRTPYI